MLSALLYLLPKYDFPPFGMPAHSFSSISPLNLEKQTSLRRSHEISIRKEQCPPGRASYQPNFSEAHTARSGSSNFAWYVILMERSNLAGTIDQPKCHTFFARSPH